MFVVPAVVFVAAIVLYPIGYSILQSFYKIDLGGFITGNWVWVGLENYRTQFSSPDLWRSLGVSGLYSAGTVIISFALGMGLALLLNDKFPGESVIRGLLTLPWILPTVVTATIWLWMLNGSYGFVNFLLGALRLTSGQVFWLGNVNTALAALVLVTAWGFAPFATLLLTAGLRGIPRDVIEAASIDGANGWQKFRYITMGLMRPVNATVVLLVFILSFKSFDTIYLMTRGGPGGSTTTLPLHGYQLAYTFHNYGEGAAATMVLLLVPMVLSFLYYYRSVRSEDLG